MNVKCLGSVLRWMQRAQSTTAKIPENLPLRVSGKWNVDEIYFPTNKGGMYMPGVMDAESRFMLANETCPAPENLQIYDATDMFTRAVIIASVVSDVLVSDLLRGFARGFKNAIAGRGRYHRKDQKPVHIRTASVRNRHINNSLYECQNGTVRDRIKTVRGFNSENPALLFLFITYYNFVRPHMSLNGKTPAEYMGFRWTETTSGQRFWCLRPHADQRVCATRLWPHTPRRTTTAWPEQAVSGGLHMAVCRCDAGGSCPDTTTRQSEPNRLQAAWPRRLAQECLTMPI